MQKRKFTSWFLTICLLATQVLAPDVAQAASLALLPAHNELSALEAWAPSALTGKVTARVLAENPRGVLIHIQDAHAVFEAQKNIEALLQEIKSAVPVKDIFLEGGVGLLDPKLKHFFPGGIRLEKEDRESWVREGQLTGAEAYLMGDEQVQGFGIEEDGRYWDNVELYRRVDAYRSQSADFLHAWYEVWQKEAGSYFKPALKKYLETYAAAQKEASGSAGWFDALRDYARSEWSRDLGALNEQVEFPMLARYWHLKKIDTTPDFVKVEDQKKEFFSAVKALDATENVLHEIDALVEKAKAGQIDFSGAREVFEQLAAYLPVDFSMARWPDLKTLIERIILAGEIDSDRLLIEAKRLHVQIIKKDAAGQKQRGLALLLEKQILLSKLLSLELAREDFQKILKHPARPEGLMRELLSFGLAGDQSFGFDKQQAADLSRVYEDAIHFYDGAIERESVMRQTILGKIKKDRVSVVVTGGFHARGMEAFAREQNWNYVAVMPRISKIQPEDFAHYRRALLGEGRARSEMSAPSEVAAALITSPQAMRDPHAAERVEAVLSLPGAEEALRRMESHAALRDDRNNARMQKVAAASREDEGFPEISLEEVSASKMRSETRLILPVPERPVYWAINGAGATGGEALKANYINDKWIRVLYDGAMNTRNEKAILRVINGIAPEKIPDFVERLKHHSTHGAFLAHGRPVEIETGKDNEGEEFPGTHWIRINGDKKIYVLNERGGVQTIPWGKFKIHTVIESTGKFKNTEAAAGHLSRSVTEKFYEGIVSREAVRSDDSGAQRVIISTGFDKELSDAPTIVMGSNQDELKQNAQHKITSNASCTTNCIAPLVQPFLKIFSNGLLMTVHAATNSQDPRSALRNISPAKTGAAKNIGLIFSAAKGKLDGAALRVPIANVSLSEVTLELKGRFSAEDVNAMLEQASENELSGILEYRGSEDLTSTKVMSSSASVVVQGNKTKTIVSEDGESTLVKLSGWYDNERGFSTRLIDHILYTAWVDEQVENGGIDLEGKKAELKKPKKTVEPLAPEEVPSLGNALEMPSFEGSVRTVISNGMTLSGKTLIRHILLTQPKLNLVAVNGVKGIASADAAARQKAAKAFIRWLQREDDSVKYRAEDAQKKLRSFEIKQGDFDGGQLTEGEGKLTWLVFNDQKILLLEQGGETKNLPWNFVKVDTVFETASKRGKTDLEGHLSAGARSVILTGAAEGVPVFQWGVNSVQQPSKTFVMSTGGAETGAMAPVLKFLHDFFGAKRAMFTGAVTVSDKDTALDGNLTAAAGVNIIPKESLAGNDVSHLIPGLAVKGSLNTVPNHDASALVVQVELGKTTTAAELNQYLKAASRSIYKGVFTYIDESDTASSQFVDAELPVIDLKQTIVAGGSLAQILIWTSREAFAKTASNLALSFAVQKARSEARPLPENLKQYLEQLKDENGRWPDSVAERAIPAIEEIMDRKERQLAKQSNLLKAMRESTDKVSREVPVIEQISESVWDDYNIKFLNLAVRVAYALAVFDSVNFPRVHAYLMEFVDKLQPQKNLMSSDRLGHPRDYAVVNNIFDRAEMELTVDENVMLRYAMNTLILQMPRYERRAMEKESLILEFVKERRQPGSGNIPAIVFLTDYHGSTRIGSLIGHAFGLKNYQNIHTPEELETRLAAEGIDPDKVNLLFIGGSDYVDRGPEPLSGFRFNQWLRKRGKLEFINGNHEWWKDWNILGLHFRVNDALRQVAENPNQTPEKAYEAVKSFVTLDKLSDEQKSMELAKVYGILKAFLENITKAGSDLEAAIQTTADLIISSGSNAQHSLEFWAREWYEHSQWADVFLDQLNAEIINEKIRKANRAIQAKHVQHLHLAIQYSGDKLSPEVKALLARNLDNGLLFEEISSAAFSKNSVVQETLKKNKKLKKENEEIRTANEQMALAGRFSELKPQHKVQTAFELTSAEAIKMADQINHAFEVLNETLKEVSDLHLDTGSLDLVTPENYRQNEVVRETANWDLKNMGLIFTDIYENFFVHGIIPITDDGKEFDVAYKGLHGVDAIERMQNDIRKFFEEHSDLNDSAESRALIWKHLGEAFGVINSWYSDTLAHLKPARIVKFKEKGGPAEFPYEYESSLSSRKFKGTKGMVHVGHVEAGKLRKADIPYWFGGMKGGLIHGDYEASEGSYAGLGAYISHFRRGPDGKLMGIRRFGYKETVAYYEKKLKEAREPKTGEPSAELIAKIEADLKRVRTTGDTVSDLTLDPEDLSGEEKANAEPLMDGNNLVDYYVIRFLEENIESYEKLRQGAVKRGFEARAAHYEAKRNWSKEYLEQYRQLIGRSEARAPISGPESTNRSESRVAEAVEFAIKNKRNLSAELLAKDIDALLDRGGKSFNPKDYLHVVRDLYARGEPDLADQLAVLFRDNLAQMREIRSVINLSETYLLNYSGSAQVQEFMQALIWIVEQKRINRLKNFSPEDPSERREGEYIDRQFKSIQKKLKDLIFEWTGVAADEKAEMFTNYESKYHLDWLSQGESDWSLIEGAYAGDFIRSTELKIYESLKAWLLTSKDLSFYSLSQRRQQEWMNGIEVLPRV